MSKVTRQPDRPTGRPRDDDPTSFSPEGYALGKQQNYRRLRRARKKFEKTILGNSVAEQAVKYRKPLSEWDNEELARGKPRDKNGKFSGPTPKWVTSELHEEAMDRFTSIVKTGMRVATVDAIEVIKMVLNDDTVDNRGKPVTPASTKLQAAQFLIEHVVGKPTQRIEQDVSVKLQAILGQVMVNPTEDGGGSYAPAHFPGMTMQLAEAAGVDDDEELPDE